MSHKVFRINTYPMRILWEPLSGQMPQQTSGNKSRCYSAHSSFQRLYKFMRSFIVFTNLLITVQLFHSELQRFLICKHRRQYWNGHTSQVCRVLPQKANQVVAVDAVSVCPPQAGQPPSHRLALPWSFPFKQRSQQPINFLWKSPFSTQAALRLSFGFTKRIT